METKNFDKTHLFVRTFSIMINKFHVCYFIIYKKFEKIYIFSKDVQVYIAKLI